MKSIKMLSLVAAAIIMSACTSSSNNRTPDAAEAQTPISVPHTTSTAPDRVFHCQNGMIATVKYNAGEDKIRLHVSTVESSAILSMAPSGSGERYVSTNAFYDKPAEFHFKGKDGSLNLQDPYGNQVSTLCQGS